MPTENKFFTRKEAVKILKYFSLAFFTAALREKKTSICFVIFFYWPNIRGERQPELSRKYLPSQSLLKLIIKTTVSYVREPHLHHILVITVILYHWHVAWWIVSRFIFFPPCSHFVIDFSPSANIPCNFSLRFPRTQFFHQNCHLFACFVEQKKEFEEPRKI